MTPETAHKVLDEGFAPWVRALNIEITEIGAEGCTMVIPINEDIMRIGGIVSGQALAALADTAMVFACFGHLDALEPVDSVKHVKYFKKGQLKEKGTYYHYASGDYIYERPVGTFLSYYHDGGVLSEIEYDKFGTHIKRNFFMGDGGPWFTEELMSITTSATNLDEFISSGVEYLTFTYWHKDYAWSNKLCKYYLKKEGAKENWRKTGTWRHYNPDGSVKKEKQLK